MSLPERYNFIKVSAGARLPINSIDLAEPIITFKLWLICWLEESILNITLLLPSKKLKNPDCAGTSLLSPALKIKPSPASSHLIFPSFTSPPKIRGVDTKVPNVGFKFIILSVNCNVLFPL